jgi:hypothetical protein
MGKRYFSLLAVLLFLAMLVYGCGKDDNGGGGQTADKLIDQGWTKFDAGNFSGAGGDFSAAIALDSTAKNYEGLLGLGWAELRRSNAGLAEKAFVAYLAKVSTSDDAKAGLSLAYLAEQKFQDAIDNALSVLSSAPSWSFGHDSNYNHLDLKLVVVQGYCLSANYEQSLAAINQYFDSSFNPGDLNTDQGRKTLADKIETLYTG